MIGPTDLLHPSPAPHFKAFQANYNFTLIPHVKGSAQTECVCVCLCVCVCGHNGEDVTGEG